MKIFFSTLTFFIMMTSLSCFQAQAYPIYSYRPSAFKISDEQFRRNFRPQFQQIIKEFYGILKQLDPVNGDIIEIKQTLLAMNFDWIDWSKRCQSIDYECTLELRTFYNKAKELDRRLLSIQKEKLNLSTVVSGEKLDSILLLDETLGRMANDNMYIIHLIEEFLMTSNTAYFRSLANSEKFMPILHRMLISSEMIVTSQIEKKYRKEFDFLWEEFISHLEKYVVLKSDKEYLLRRMDDFNMAWNVFHMRAVKSDVELPSFAQKVIGHIHNQWNSIIRFFLSN